MTAYFLIWAFEFHFHPDHISNPYDEEVTQTSALIHASQEMTKFPK